MPTPAAPKTRRTIDGRIFPSREFGPYALSLQGGRGWHGEPRTTLDHLEDYETVEAIIYGPGGINPTMLHPAEIGLGAEVCRHWGKPPQDDVDVPVGVKVTWDAVRLIEGRLAALAAAAPEKLPEAVEAPVRRYELYHLDWRRHAELRGKQAAGAISPAEREVEELLYALKSPFGKTEEELTTLAIMALDMGLYVKVAEVEADGLATVWTITNSVERPWTENPGVATVRPGARLRSTSVGDVVVDPAGRHHLCGSMGWSGFEFGATCPKPV